MWTFQPFHCIFLQHYENVTFKWFEHSENIWKIWGERPPKKFQKNIPLMMH